MVSNTPKKIVCRIRIRNLCAARLVAAPIGIPSLIFAKNARLFPLPEIQIVGKRAKFVKGERFLPKVHSARGHAPVWRQGRNGSGGSIGSICNRTTRNCVFSLDTTRAEAQNSGNFSDCCTVQGRHGGTRSERDRATFQRARLACPYEGRRVRRNTGAGSTWRPPEKRGIKRAVFAWLDCAMHQSGMRGARPLAARRHVRGRILQQL